MRQGVGNAISIMGARPTSNNFTIDGTANVDTSLGTPAAILSVEAIEEFKEQTRTYSAAYGWSANQINLVSKSGTNDFHGALFGFFRNEAWDARNFFDPPGVSPPELDQKQFGGLVRGPLVRDKTFFLASYEGTRVRRARARSTPCRVPTSWRDASGRRSWIPSRASPSRTTPSATASRGSRRWPCERDESVPNVDLPQGNYQVVQPCLSPQDQWTLRLDQDLGRLGRAFVRFTKTTYDNRTSSNLLDLGDRVFVQDTTQWQVSHTWPVRPGLVNSFRLGRLVARADQHGIPCDRASVDFLDFSGVFENVADDQRECPQIAIGGYSGTGGAINAYAASRQPMWDVGNSTTWVRGPHTLSLGLGFRRWQLQRDLATGFLGNHSYGLGGTSGFSGSSVADFLLGYYSGGSVFQPAAFSVPGAAGNPREFNFTSVAPFFAFRTTGEIGSRLTLNLGMRWDYRSVPYETNDRMAWRNPDYAPGGLLVADRRLVEGGIVDGAYYRYAGRRSPENPDRFKVFAPRLGFAWRPSGALGAVVRGGYGLFYDSAEGRELDGAADVYPYVSRGNYVQSLGQPTPLSTTDQLYPSFRLAGVATPAANTFLAVSASPRPRNPRVHQWSLGVQKQLPRSTIVELNYVGSHGANLLMRQNVAQALAYSPERPAVASRKPYQNFEVFIDSNWGGRSDYHAANLKVDHHGPGLLLTLVYTWAKSTDSKSAAAETGASAYNGWQGFLDNHDPGRDHGLSDFDVDHRAVASFVWSLPFGTSGGRGLGRTLVGGFQLSGIYTWQHGFPITIEAADLGGVLDTFGANRADVVGDIHRGGGDIGRWFDTAAFAQPAVGAVRRLGPEHPARARNRQPRPRAVEDRGAQGESSFAAPGSSLQRPESPAVHGGLHEHRERQLRSGHGGAAGADQSARAPTPLVTSGTAP